MPRAILFDLDETLTDRPTSLRSWCPWPNVDDAFVLAEGEAYGWFTIDEALTRPDVAAYVPDSLRAFRDRLTGDG